MTKYLVDVYYPAPHEKELILFAWPVDAPSSQTATKMALDTAITPPYFVGNPPKSKASLSVEVFAQDSEDAGKWVSISRREHYKRIVESKNEYFMQFLCFHTEWSVSNAHFSCPHCHFVSTVGEPYHYRTCEYVYQGPTRCTLHFGPKLAQKLIERGRTYGEESPLYECGNLTMRVFKELFPSEALTLSAK